MTILRILYYIDDGMAKNIDRVDYDRHVKFRYDSTPSKDAEGNIIPYTEWKDTMKEFIDVHCSCLPDSIPNSARVL
jgi:hypothetical protein